MLLIEPISAITSWEDYEYQGHIALYVVLKKIYEALCSGEDISTSELQIEGEEDFSIRKDDKYLSLHQVKAGTIYLNENDKFSYIIEILQNNAKHGYFHIANGKKIPDDFVNSTLTYINKLQCELKKTVIEKKDLNDTDKEEDYIIVEKISGNHKKADVYSIIKYVSKNSKDINKIKDVVKDIKVAVNEFKTIINKTISEQKLNSPSLKDDEAFLSIYEERFDNAKEIRSKAYQVIVNIIRRKCPSYIIFADADYAALVYDQLLLFMKDCITNFYIQKNKNGKCILSYDKILKLIITNYHEKIDTQEYQYFQVLRAIRDTYAEYPNEPWNRCTAINCKDCKDSGLCNLFKQISILNSKTEKEKSQIIHNLILRTPQSGKSNNLPTDSLIAHLFLFLLDEINILRLEKNNVYQATKDGLKIYRLSLDSSYDVSDFQKKLERELEKNPNKSLLYEFDVLITDRLNEDSVIFNGANINVLTAKELNEIREITSTTVEQIKKDCNKPKVVRLIDQKSALGELK